MRKFLIPLLLATTVASPAVAQRADGEREGPRRERSEEPRESEERRPEPRVGREVHRPKPRVQRPPVERPQPRIEAPERRVAPRDVQLPRPPAERGRPSLDVRERPAPRGPIQRVRPDLRDRTPQDIDGPERPRVRPGDDRPALRDGRPDRDVLRPDLAVHPRVRPAVRPARVVPPREARPDRPAPPPQVAERRRPSPRWDSGWRRDRRHDWRDYRRRNHSLFRIGVYFDPFGWRYNRYGVGWRLWPSYYSRNYWLHDPWMYRLPYAPYPYQWIRYWNDALLVNTYTGQVVDVEYDFFW